MIYLTPELMCLFKVFIKRNKTMDYILINADYNLIIKNYLIRHLTFSLIL